MNLISRPDAKAAGHKRYFTGLLCGNGHVEPRLVSNGVCLGCERDKMAKRRAAARAEAPPRALSARKAAQAAGAVRYMTGKPCVAGHIAERFTSSGRCCVCADEEQRRLLEERPEKHRARVKRWMDANPDKRRAIKRAPNAERRASQLKRTPGWLTADDRRKIKVKHAEARWMTQRTGIPHAVDHIYPLQGRSVSGLHVPANMRVIPRRENSRKHNKMPVIAT